jgi:hypothetical protein
MRLLGSVLLVLGWLAPGAWAWDGDVAADELAKAPTQERVAAWVEQAATRGWGELTPGLRAAAFRAYEAQSGSAAAWYYLYRWSALLGRKQTQATQDWIMAVNAAKVGHPNMPANPVQRTGSLGAILPADLQRLLLADGEFSEEFFGLLSPVDQPTRVLEILAALQARAPADFREYRSLAIAVALVYDVPPPPHWPHGQVSAAVLPRRWPAPEEAFGYWVRLDRGNFTMHRLRRLPASELKFLVDLAAPFTELDWGRRNVGPGLTDLPQAYTLVKYRQDRLKANQFMWPKADYRLATILAEGGICVDQAYFATTVGKAKGIPTILFRGAGLDGRHAWFGHLDGQQRWHLDGGRFAEQKYVAGVAFDPQTWADINDHELLFLSERFRALPTYRLSVMHALFAADYLAAGQPAAALTAAREAVNRDRRNLGAWKTLVLAQRAGDVRAAEEGLREAMLAFQKYPDLEVMFARQLIDALRARGETSQATFEEQRLAKKYQAGRTDLGNQQAAAMLAASAAKDDLPTQIRVYQQVLAQYGRGKGTDFYDQVVVPFVRRLQAQAQVPAAISSLERARRTLRVEKGGQLEAEIAALLAELKTRR